MPDLEKIIPEFNKLLQALIDDPVSAISKIALLLLVAVIYSIRKRLGDNLLTIVDKAISQLTLIGIKWFSNYSFNLRYKKHIIFEHRVFNVRGLRTQGTFTLEIDKVYVNLRIAPSLNPNQPPNLTNHTVLTGNRPIWNFLQQGFKVLAVIGAPGCGKSTLLQHIALTFAANRQRAYRLPAYTPILLFLRDHIEKIVTDEVNLAQLAQGHFSNEQRYPNLNPPEHWFKAQLNKGKAIVLLDGLDEVADADKRHKVSAWMDRQIITYCNCPFIVTSRPQGYLVAPLQQAHRLEIQPFTWSQVREFAYSWYRQNEILSFGKKDEGVLNEAKRKADDLLKRLQQLPALHTLTVNPLLLTMIAMVHRYRGQLPGRRVELYAEICDVLLGHWRAAVGIQDSLTTAQKRVLLQPLAAAMMHSNRRDITTEQVLSIIAEPLRQVGISQQDAGEQFLKDIEAGSGLLNESENHYWSFAHLTFQEYLTACHWLKQQTELAWHDRVNQSWWHETIRLYVAQASAGDIICACLQQNTLPSLTLASECADEALALDEPTRQSLQAVLAQNLDSTDASRSQLAAEVLLNRRLKNLQTVNDTTEIDPEFISCAEYQLFLDEIGKNYQPAHWQTKRFPKGMAKHAVLGVRAADAQAFCKWLSEKTGEYFRLPKPSEIQQTPIKPGTSQYATWCLTQGDYDLFWQQLSEKNNCLQRMGKSHPLSFQLGSDLLKKCGDKHKIVVYSHRYFYNFARRYYTFNLAFDLARDHDFARALDLASARALAIARALDLDLDLDLDLARDLTLTLALARDLALDLALDLDRALGRSTSTIYNLKRGIAILEMSPTPYMQQQAKLFNELLASLEAPDPDIFSVRQAARKITLFELETLLTRRWVDFCDFLKPQTNWKESLLFWKKNRTNDTALLKEILLAWFWAYKIIDARIEGELPAWEGIRLVRERSSNSD